MNAPTAAGVTLHVTTHAGDSSFLLPDDGLQGAVWMRDGWQQAAVDDHYTLLDVDGYYHRIRCGDITGVQVDCRAGDPQ